MSIKSTSVVKLKKNKALDLMWHEDSTVVFKDKKAIGRFSDGEFVPFDEETLKLCETYKFKYDPAIISTEEEEEEQDDEEPGEGEEEEVENQEKEEKVENHKQEEDDSTPTSVQVRVEAPTGVGDILCEFKTKLFAHYDSVLEAHNNKVTTLDLKVCSLTQENEKLKSEKEALQKSLTGIQAILGKIIV